MTTVKFMYKNHRGDVAKREVVVESISFIKTPAYGYQPGWFLNGHDVNKDARRSFALVNIIVPLDKSIYEIELNKDATE